jgi:hypothetical protein
MWGMVRPPKVLKANVIASLLAFYMTAMADTSTENAVQAASTHDTDNLGQPREQLEVDEGGISDENITYPTGPKLWLTMTSLCIAYFLNGLVGSRNVIEGTGKLRVNLGPHHRCSRCTQHYRSIQNRF